jgi:S1-C subfamily serine protease
VALRPVLYDGRSWGLLILEVQPEGAAARASLRVGDILVGVDSQRIESLDTLNDALDSGAPVVRLAFLRGDRAHVREAVTQIRTEAVGAEAA